MIWTLPGFVVTRSVLYFDGGCQLPSPHPAQGGDGMNILFPVAAAPPACFAEGAILAASVYLVSRGGIPVAQQKEMTSAE